MKNKDFKHRRRYDARDRRREVLKHNTREYMYSAVHQNLDLQVNSGSKIKSLYKAPIHGVRYKADKDTIIKDLLNVKPYADASEETFLNTVHSATTNTFSLAGQVPDTVDTMYIIPSRAQIPDLRTWYNGQNTDYSFTMPRTRDFVNSCNNIFTLLQSNSAYSNIPIMSYSTYGPSQYNVNQGYIHVTDGNGGNFSDPDSNPFWTSPNTQNAIWSFADSACVNVAAVSTILMTWRQDRILLDVLSRRHPDIAGWLQNAKSLISAPKFRSVLENIARLLSRIPVDIDWVDRVVRMSTAVSQKSDSILEPVVYTTSSFMMPAYSIGTSPTSTTGFFFTPDFRNTGWRTENSGGNPVVPFYAKNVGFGCSPFAPGLVSSLTDSYIDSASPGYVTQWVEAWFKLLSTTLVQVSSLVNMYEPWTALVRLASQSGFAKWFGYTVPYLEPYKPSYEPNIHNLLRYPSVKMTQFSSNGNATYSVTAERGIINEDSVSPYRVSVISTEYNLNQDTDYFGGNVPNFTPLWRGNETNGVDGVISDAPYQFPELILYTLVYVNTFNGLQLSFMQSDATDFTNNNTPVYNVTAAWTVYSGTANFIGNTGVSLTSAPNGSPTFNYLVDTFGAIAVYANSNDSISGWYYSPVLTAVSASFPISVIIPNITVHLQQDFRSTSPFREIMENPGNTLLLG